MANTNCLAGMKCPKCGSEGPFDISVQAFARVHDDGVDEVWDFEWQNESPCDCRECKFEGKVEDFLHV